MEPPLLDQLGPEGTLSAGVRPQDLGLTGGVIHYSEDNLVALQGPWTPRLETGMWGLFRFQYLTAAQDAPAEINFRLTYPATEPSTTPRVLSLQFKGFATDFIPTDGALAVLLAP